MSVKTNKITICRGHRDYEVPLIWTFVFNGAEYWCPYCGDTFGMFNGCPDVEETPELKKRLALYERYSRQYLKARGVLSCSAMMYKGKRIPQSEIPQELKDKSMEVIKAWESHKKVETEVEFKPARVVRQRTKGWKMPIDCVYVGRPTKFGNPFIVGEYPDEDFINFFDEEDIRKYFRSDEADFPVAILKITREDAVRLYEKYNMLQVAEFLEDLRGKDLCCWCNENEVCHADVLLKHANQ